MCLRHNTLPSSILSRSCLRHITSHRDAAPQILRHGTRLHAGTRSASRHVPVRYSSRGTNSRADDAFTLRSFFLHPPAAVRAFRIGKSEGKVLYCFTIYSTHCSNRDGGAWPCGKRAGHVRARPGLGVGVEEDVVLAQSIWGKCRLSPQCMRAHVAVERRKPPRGKPPIGPWTYML